MRHVLHLLQGELHANNTCVLLSMLMLIYLQVLLTVLVGYLLNGMVPLFHGGTIDDVVLLQVCEHLQDYHHVVELIAAMIVILCVKLVSIVYLKLTCKYIYNYCQLLCTLQFLYLLFYVFQILLTVLH